MICGIVAATLSAVLSAPSVAARVAAHVAAPAAGVSQVNADAQTIADFRARVNRYVQLHRDVEARLPVLNDKATPEEIDAHQRMFATQLAAARKDARVGDIFAPDMQVMTRTLLQRLFATSDERRELREAVMDENPGPAAVRLTVNGRYPDTVPISTMPPQVLRSLPELPRDVEYRFVGETLILLDPDAHIVVDFVEHALPR
jgi:hypothetical protein